MPLDLDGLNKQTPKVDNLLTSIENIWKKHWKLLCVLIVCYGMYKFVNWAINLPPVEPQQYPAYDEQPYPQDSVYDDQYQYRDSIYPQEDTTQYQYQYRY